MVPPRGVRAKLGGRITRKSETKTRVLFVCIGNSCRSQMAEGFARAYGSDVMVASSAGLSPAAIIAPMTRQVLSEKNISIDDHFPKDLDSVSPETFDIMVNLSGVRLNLPAARQIDWPVRDPIGEADEVYRSVAGEIEGLVMRFILELRSAR
jgi:arsenate reductase